MPRKVRKIIGIDPDVHEALESQALSTHTSITYLVETACIEYYSLPVTSTARETFIRDRALAQATHKVQRAAAQVARRAQARTNKQLQQAAQTETQVTADRMEYLKVSATIYDTLSPQGQQEWDEAGLPH